MDTRRRLREIQRTFVAPPPLTESRPRALTLTGGGRALWTVAVLLLVGSIAAGIGMYREASGQAEARRAIVGQGVMTTGDVSRLWDRGDNRRRVKYRFTIDGRVYEGERRVSAERRRTLQVGAPIEVRYLPSDPGVNDLGGTPRSGMPMALPFIIAPLIAAGGALCLLGLRGQRQLLAEGRAAPAIVTEHHTHSSSHGGKHRSMTYEFALLSGAVVSGKSGASSKPPAIGSVICVIYDPDRPTRNRVYPFSLVKPAR